MSGKKDKKETGSSFPKDSYTENFIKDQENQYNFDYKSTYDYESKIRRPKLLSVINSIPFFAGASISFWLTYQGITSFLKEKNVMGIIVASLMGGGFGVIMVLGFFREARKSLRKK